MISVKDLSAFYGAKTVFEKANFEVSQGKLTVLLGPNGSGKTTLLRTLAGMHPEFSGAVFLNGKSLQNFRREEISRHVSVVLTVPVITPLKVFDVIASGRFPYVNRFNMLKTNDMDKIEQIARELDLQWFLDRPVTELSDGERQRVMIARALVQETPVILLDEPDTHLDITHRAEMLVLLKRIAQQGKTVLLSTHYLDLIPDIADDVVLIYRKHVIKSDMTEAVEQDLLGEVFSSDLLIFDQTNRQFKLKK